MPNNNKLLNNLIHDWFYRPAAHRGGQVGPAPPALHFLNLPGVDLSWQAALLS